LKLRLTIYDLRAGFAALGSSQCKFVRIAHFEQDFLCKRSKWIFSSQGKLSQRLDLLSFLIFFVPSFLCCLSVFAPFASLRLCVSAASLCGEARWLPKHPNPIRLRLCRAKSLRLTFSQFKVGSWT
jgi:hypothetical protein